jgi:4-hydroxy-2-oxoheptanedioate aldolase
VLTVILIEDILAVENIDEILTVEGIDVFFVAFADLAQSMGYIHDLAHPEVQHATIN